MDHRSQQAFLSREEVAYHRSSALIASRAADARARNQKMDQAARYVLRQQETPSLLNKIHALILAQSKSIILQLGFLLFGKVSRARNNALTSSDGRLELI